MALEWLAPAIAGTAEATTGIFGALAGMRNTDQANAINAQYANLNYQHQLDREKIEDSRYAEETAYNRAFAEDERFFNRQWAQDERNYQRAFAADERAYQRQWAQEQRDYNRALQQQIFEREDTAISRQVNELSKLGINPLSANMNGLGAGSVVSSSPSGVSSSASGVGSPTTSTPSSSGRGNSSPAQLNYQKQLYDFSHIINAISSVAQGVDGVISAQYQRDALQLQNDAQYLSNLEKAHDLGLSYWTPNRLKGSKRKPTIREIYGNPENKWEQSFGWKTISNLRTKINSQHAMDAYLYDTDDEKTRLIKNLANGDFIDIATNLINNLKKAGDNLDFLNPFKK